MSKARVLLLVDGYAGAEAKAYYRPGSVTSGTDGVVVALNEGEGTLGTAEGGGVVDVELDSSQIASFYDSGSGARALPVGWIDSI